MASGGAISQGWFHRDQPELSTQRNSPLLQWPWHGGAVDQGGQVRPELDPAFLPQVGDQPGETMAVRPDLQPGQLYEKAGVAGGYEALDSDQSSDQADQDGWATGTPRKEAGASACRGVGDQGNADRDTSITTTVQGGMREVRLGAWRGSAWPVRYYPAYPRATATTHPARTVPGAAFPAPPGRPAAS